MAGAIGDQPTRVVSEAHERGPADEPASPKVSARAAVTFSKDGNLEREAVVDERALMRDALSRSMGQRTVDEIRTEFERRVEAGEFIEMDQKPGAPEIGRAHV